MHDFRSGIAAGIDGERDRYAAARADEWRRVERKPRRGDDRGDGLGTSSARRARASRHERVRARGAIVEDLLALKRQLPAGAVLLVGGRVEAGTNFNVVPSECCFTVDRRTTADEDFAAERRRLLAVFDRARASGIDVAVDVFQEGSVSRTPDDVPLARALASSVMEVTGAAPGFEECPGLLETRFYAERGIPALAYGPGILAVSHGPQEFVKISRMLEVAKIYALTALKLMAKAT